MNVIAHLVAIAVRHRTGDGVVIQTQHSDRPILALPDIPFLCDFRRALQITPLAPYTEIASFMKYYPDLQQRAMRTLSYFDGFYETIDNPRSARRAITESCIGRN